MKPTPAPLLLPAAMLVFICAGCATVPEDIHDGLVGKHYISPFCRTATLNIPVPVSLRVNQLESLPPLKPGDFLPLRYWVHALTPIVSFWLPPLMERNTFRQSDINDWSNDAGTKTGRTRPSSQNVRTVYRLGQDELATVLAREIEKNGVATEVRVGGTPADFELRGTANFILETTFCTYGLGMFAGFAYLPNLPILRQTGRCEAHFQLVSRDGKTTLLNKYYSSERRWKTTLWHLELPAVPSRCGQVLFPDVVLELMIDLLSIPPSKLTATVQSRGAM